MKTQLISRLAPLPFVLLALACWWPGAKAQAAGNDNFADAWLITSLPYTTNCTNLDATSESGEPYHHSSTVGHSLWWRWTAPASGPVQLNTTNTGLRSVLGVYTGSAVGSLTEVVSGRGKHLLNFIAVAGTTYQIALDSLASSDLGGFVFQMMPGLAPPANDNFANATVLTGTTVSLTTTNLGATKEAGEPNSTASPGGKSIWYTWTAPLSGSFQLDTTGSTFDTMLAVYTGTALNNLSLVASNDNFSGITSLLTFNAAAGTSYFFLVDGWEGKEGQVSLHLTPPAPPPANDNFANATVLIGSTLSISNTVTTSATKESGEPNHAADTGGHSVWWWWTAPASGSVQVDTIGSSFDTLLAVYTGAMVSNLSMVASDDQSGGNNTSLLAFYAQAGTTYRIAVDGWQGAAGTAVLHVIGQPPTGPLNDYFANATVVTSTNYSISNYSNAGAGLEAGEPNPCGFPGGASVWWRWTPPFTGLAQVDTLGASMYTILSIYTGSTVSNLVPVTCAWAMGATLYFPVTNGITYSIMVDGYLGNTGSFNVHMGTAPPPPSNDNFTNAAVIAGFPYTTNLSTVAATKEPGEPDHNGRPSGKSVWWKWTASSAARMQLNTTNSTIQTVVGIYTGSALGSLTPVASGYGNHKVYFDVAAGTTYLIAVDDSHATGGNVNLFFGLAPTSPANDLFSNATVLTGNSVSISNASNVAASKESGEPNPAGDAGGKSVWWRWTAPASGPVQVDTMGSSFDTILGIYTGSAVNSLTEIASDDQSGGFNTSRTNFNATADVTYLIAVDGWHGQEGNVVLHVTGPTPTLFQGSALVPTNGQLHLQFLVTGPAGSNVVILANTNLSNLDTTNWVPLLTNNLNAGSFLFTDPDPATVPQKFYRAWLP